MHVQNSVQQRGRQPGTENSAEEIDKFRLISQRPWMSGKYFRRNNSTLQKFHTNTMNSGEGKVERFRHFWSAGLVLFGLLLLVMGCFKGEKAKYNSSCWSSNLICVDCSIMWPQGCLPIYAQHGTARTLVLCYC